MGLPPEALKQMGEQIASQVPQKRFGSPEDIAHAVLYLSSEESGYVHGASLAVDGGMTAA
jgi:NAD(P)-dependent dehydrogenase (short-subunit alcohol dehydrogenase family)